MRIVHSFNWQRFLLVAITIDALLFLAGCSTNWITEAQSILALLGPAVASLLEILSAFGVGISPATAAAVQSWEQQAQIDLNTVSSLITQYNAAEAAAKPGLLIEIQTWLTTIAKNAATILGEIHITDPATQAKFTAIFNAVLDEVTALINLIPAVQLAAAEPDEDKAEREFTKAAKKVKIKSAKDFAAAFNRLADGFGTKFEIATPS
jgi:hypothetical protein